ncbi:MAG: DUF4332 domain-containing protein [Rhodospirillales bacterium]|nr:DUF4332 domain-containing protein [Rhodospirillales bacterium]
MLQENEIRKIKSSQLQRIGIRKPSELLEACRSGEKRKKVAALTGISEERLKIWVSQTFARQDSELAQKVIRILEADGLQVIKPTD